MAVFLLRRIRLSIDPSLDCRTTATDAIQGLSFRQTQASSGGHGMTNPSQRARNRHQARYQAM
jgi:hypothetical protein